MKWLPEIIMITVSIYLMKTMVADLRHVSLFLFTFCILSVIISFVVSYSIFRSFKFYLRNFVFYLSYFAFCIQNAKTKELSSSVFSHFFGILSARKQIYTSWRKSATVDNYFLLLHSVFDGQVYNAEEQSCV